MIAQSFRYWIADLIAGGEMTELEARASFQHWRADKWFADALHTAGHLNIARGHLRTIAAMETPGANATVRRMASVAREAVKP